MRYAITALLLLATAVGARAEALRVIDTAPNDVLNVREYPTTEAKIVGVIPPDGRGVQHTGERMGAWLFVRYRNVEGWASSRFLVPEAPPIRRGRDLTLEQ